MVWHVYTCQRVCLHWLFYPSVHSLSPMPGKRKIQHKDAAYKGKNHIWTSWGPLKVWGAWGSISCSFPLGGPACARSSSHARALDWFLVSASGKIWRPQNHSGLVHVHGNDKCTAQRATTIPWNSMGHTYHEMSATINECQVQYQEMLGTYPIAGIHETVRYWNVIYMTRSRYGWNNTGSLVALWPVQCMYLMASNTMQETMQCLVS